MPGFTKWACGLSLAPPGCLTAQLWGNGHWGKRAEKRKSGLSLLQTGPSEAVQKCRAQSESKEVWAYFPGRPSGWLWLYRVLTSHPPSLRAPGCVPESPPFFPGFEGPSPTPAPAPSSAQLSEIWFTPNPYLITASKPRQGDRPQTIPYFCT